MVSRASRLPCLFLKFCWSTDIILSGIASVFQISSWFWRISRGFEPIRNEEIFGWYKQKCFFRFCLVTLCVSSINRSFRDHCLNFVTYKQGSTLTFQLTSLVASDKRDVTNASYQRFFLADFHECWNFRFGGGGLALAPSSACRFFSELSSLPFSFLPPVRKNPLISIMEKNRRICFWIRFTHSRPTLCHAWLV